MANASHFCGIERTLNEIDSSTMPALQLVQTHNDYFSSLSSGLLVQQINAKIPQNSSLNHASIKFGAAILKGPLFHKRVLAMQKFKMAVFFPRWLPFIGQLPHFREYMGVTDAFSMVSNPIQSPICSSIKVIFVTLAITSAKTKMASNMAAKSSINLISATIQC